MFVQQYTINTGLLLILIKTGNYPTLFWIIMHNYDGYNCRGYE